MGALFEYLQALWQHWTWIMTGGPFLAERIARFVWPGYDKWAEKFIPPVARQRLIVGAAIVGIFVASFLAFNDERTQLQVANGIIAASVPAPSVPWEPLSSESIGKLKTAFKALPQKPNLYIAVSGDSSVTRLASQLSKAFGEIGSTAPITSFFPFDDKQRGILIAIKNHENPSEKSKGFLQALSAGGLVFNTSEIGDEAGPLTDFMVIILPRARPNS